MKGLTTHVLDTLHGSPAQGVAVELVSLSATGTTLSVSNQITDAQGRCMMAEALEVGEYELRFELGAYFRSKLSKSDSESLFLNMVPVRFYIDDAEQHYHIPLVASPWAYSTYKGGAPKHGAKA